MNTKERREMVEELLEFIEDKGWTVQRYDANVDRQMPKAELGVWLEK